MGPNTQIRDFETNLVEIINKNTLPIEIKKLVLADIYRAVCAAADGAIAQEEKEEKQDERME